MVYTELAPRWLQFHVAPAMPALFMWHQPCQRLSTPLRWILKKEKKKKEKKRKKRYKKLVTHVEPQASAVSLLKRAENSAI